MVLVEDGYVAIKPVPVGGRLPVAAVWGLLFIYSEPACIAIVVPTALYFYFSSYFLFFKAIEPP
jgi:hypothetical protein